MVLDGVTVTKGDEVKVDGLRGRFWFRAHIEVGTAPDTEWLEVYGGTSGKEKARSFTVERVHPRTKRRKKK